MAYAPTSGGYFAMKEKREVATDLATRYGNPVNQRRFAAAQDLARCHGVAINDVVLAYLINQPNQTIPVLGGSSPARIEEGVRAADLDLNPEELARLRA
ncbi:aldo/keto reductase [Novosphingobium mathurense]|uniref:Aldo/keto reductase family protein n=1 Tax=Novosphingobium mathurense TaxID=428990 RepID=A0A1U6HYH5_9SPHN|nr:aldo/keto reductase [Novosphingobium mathurense]SLK00810.1 Aldo/keto reductase family protein [Novosphingobium mathurense]